jgi:hypothetical protein
MTSQSIHVGLVLLLTGLFCISIQLVYAQYNSSNTTNKMKVPGQLDIESQSTQQEMAAINNSVSNSTNATQQESNISNQSLQEFSKS